MSAPQWKPGDVAMSTYGRVFYSGDDERGSWTYDDGSGGFDSDFKPLQKMEPNGLRPLVVIDPENREQVERMSEALTNAGWTSPNVDRLKVALCFLVTEPKPEEPLGLGAVVEASAYDNGDDTFVRVAVPAPDSPWVNSGGMLHEWSELDDVRVLSEGWSA